MNMSETVVLVGAGQSAWQAILSLRQGGFEGKLVLIGDETYTPYQRPPLSKAFLTGDVTVSDMVTHPDHFHEEHRVELKLSTRAVSINRMERTVTLGTTENIDYDHLVLATGSRVRRLSVPGSDLDGVSYFRSLDDAEHVKARFQSCKRLAIVGAGYIGLEVAAAARSQGVDVTVVEIADRPMSRVVSPTVSAFYTSLHRSNGVDFRFDAVLAEFGGHDGKLTEARLEGGETIECDLAVVGIGVVPNVELAEEAGLECRNGIATDAHCRTSDPNIYAIGDCANRLHPILEEPMRLECVQGAVEHGRVVAAVILGQSPPPPQVPWFWSDQYDVKLQIVGVRDQSDSSIVRGDEAAGSFAAFHLRAGRLVACEAVNRQREFALCRRLVAEGARPEAAHLADESMDFKELATLASAQSTN